MNSSTIELLVLIVLILMLFVDHPRGLVGWCLDRRRRKKS